MKFLCAFCFFFSISLTLCCVLLPEAFCSLAMPSQASNMVWEKAHQQIAGFQMKKKMRACRTSCTSSSTLPITCQPWQFQGMAELPNQILQNKGHCRAVMSALQSSDLYIAFWNKTHPSYCMNLWYSGIKAIAITMRDVPRNWGPFDNFMDMHLHLLEEWMNSSPQPGGMSRTCFIRDTLFMDEPEIASKESMYPPNHLASFFLVCMSPDEIMWFWAKCIIYSGLQ